MADQAHHRRLPSRDEERPADDHEELPQEARAIESDGGPAERPRPGRRPRRPASAVPKFRLCHNGERMRWAYPRAGEQLESDGAFAELLRVASDEFDLRGELVVRPDSGDEVDNDDALLLVLQEAIRTQQAMVELHVSERVVRRKGGRPGRRRRYPYARDEMDEQEADEAREAAEEVEEDEADEVGVGRRPRSSRVGTRAGGPRRGREPDYLRDRDIDSRRRTGRRAKPQQWQDELSEEEGGEAYEARRRRGRSFRTREDRRGVYGGSQGLRLRSSEVQEWRDLSLVTADEAEWFDRLAMRDDEGFLRMMSVVDQFHSHLIGRRELMRFKRGLLDDFRFYTHSEEPVRHRATPVRRPFYDYDNIKFEESRRSQHPHYPYQSGRPYQHPRGYAPGATGPSGGPYDRHRAVDEHGRPLPPDAGHPPRQQAQPEDPRESRLAELEKKLTQFEEEKRLRKEEEEQKRREEEEAAKRQRELEAKERQRRKEEALAEQKRERELRKQKNLWLQTGQLTKPQLRWLEKRPDQFERFQLVVADVAEATISLEDFQEEKKAIFPAHLMPEETARSRRPTIGEQGEPRQLAVAAAAAAAPPAPEPGAPSKKPGFWDFLKFKSSKTVPQSVVASTGVRSGSSLTNCVLLLGQTGSGKSTFLNYICNFFAGCNPPAVRRFTQTSAHKGNRDEMQAHTQDCRAWGPFTYDGAQYTVVDTPGLADTHGLERDEQHIRNILKFASECESVVGVVFVVNGTVARKTHNLEHVFTKFQGTLPDTVLANAVVVFTNCGRDTDVSFRPASVPLLANKQTFHVQNSYKFDNVYDEESDEFAAQVRRWDESMRTLDGLMTHIGRLKGVATMEFANMIQARDEIRLKMQDAYQMIDALAAKDVELHKLRRDLEQAKRTQDFNKDFRIKNAGTRKKLVDADKHSTLCRSCDFLCHNGCGLEFTPDGGEVMKRCACMKADKTCKHCEHAWDSHYHDYKKVVDEPFDEWTEDAGKKAVFEQAVRCAEDADRRIRALDEQLAANKRQQEAAIDDVLRECQELKRVCKRFNLQAELAVELRVMKEKQALVKTTAEADRWQHAIDRVQAVADRANASR